MFGQVIHGYLVERVQRYEGNVVDVYSGSGTGLNAVNGLGLAVLATVKMTICPDTQMPN